MWQISNADLDGNPLKFLTGFQKLPNGNFLISNWLGHGKLGTAPHLMEVTRGKKIIWTFADHKNVKAIGSIHVFNDDGKPTEAKGRH